MTSLQCSFTKDRQRESSTLLIVYISILTHRSQRTHPSPPLDKIASLPTVTRRSRRTLRSIMSTLTQQPPAGLGTPPAPGSRLGTPPPASKAIPTDFKSSLAAWWNNSSYREARIAEERLLRRMSMYQPPEPGSPAAGNKGWFNFGGASADPTIAATNHTSETGATVEGKVNIASNNEHGIGDRAGEQVVNEDHTVQPVNLPGTSLVATLRNVFIPTPDPSLAPPHPADPYTASASTSGSAASSVASLDAQGQKKSLSGKKRGKEGKLVDYINTLEISNPEHGNTKEAVVVLHGYAAALG